MSDSTRGLPRLLTIMGSGETAPTMVKVHRRVVETLASALSASGSRGGGSDLDVVRGLLLDTPFGFQTNAGEIATRAVTYFRESVGARLEVAGMRSAADLEGPRGTETVAKIAEASLVFAGPGSPSYALRQWKGTLVPSLLSEKLTFGGAVTFASAAALTLGSETVPVYEIYKVGEDPHWLEGLDLLAPLGLAAVIIPHYDNTEGQTHDTRYCYLGEQRLSLMEKELPDGTFVLGVDEHTAAFVDFEERSLEVMGHGGVTLRVHGSSSRIEAGETVRIEQLLEMASGLASQVAGRRPSETDADNSSARAASATDAEGLERDRYFDARKVDSQGQGSPLLHAIRSYESDFRVARERSDAPAMVAALLGLEEEMWAWRADTLQSDEMDRGRASLRSMIKDLGQLSEVGARDPAELIGPYVDLALAIRDSARDERRFDEADSVRDRLELLGVEVHDSPDGSTWEMRSTPPAES